MIVGTRYCGSSLLNLLLDSQPAIRGLGEAVNLLPGSPAAPCSRCGGDAPCELYGAIDDGRFYGSLFDFYGDSLVLVDSSKDFSWCFGARRFESDYAYEPILLSKTPHEFAGSWLGHHPDDLPRDAFTRYIEFYEHQLDWLSRQPWFNRARCQTIRYRDLANRPEATIRAICSSLETPFAWKPDWWQSGSHIVAANRIVSAQVKDEPSGAAIEPEYLGGKYRDRFHTIFYDARWQSNAEFVGECRNLYHELERRIEPLLNLLGQRDCRQLAGELDGHIDGVDS
ncbi:MAG TPA: hypothetical protein VNH11_12315 [Pirellulales bacterium]|nr:hypothetical protein [Pirellulales bacterium]